MLPRSKKTIVRNCVLLFDTQSKITFEIFKNFQYLLYKVGFNSPIQFPTARNVNDLKKKTIKTIKE